MRHVTTSAAGADDTETSLIIVNQKHSAEPKPCLTTNAAEDHQQEDGTEEEIPLGKRMSLDFMMVGVNPSHLKDYMHNLKGFGGSMKQRTHSTNDE